MKSVQANNNYSGFSEVTTKHEVSNIRQPSGLSNSLCLYKYQTRLKSVFKMSSVCPGASSKTWSPLHAWPLHRWTLAGNVPSLRSDTTSAGRRHESGCGRHAPAASTKSDSQPGWAQDCWLATELESWSLVFLELHGLMSPVGRRLLLLWVKRHIGNGYILSLMFKK